MKPLFPAAFLLLACTAAAQQQAAPGDAIERLLDRIIEREQAFLKALRGHTPLFETYIQETGAEPHTTQDHYFLGRVKAGAGLGYEPLVERTTPPPLETRSGLLPFRSKPKLQPFKFLPRGFAQMAIPDLDGFDRRNYKFEYVRREFLGEVRCLVFDVLPQRAEPGRFQGRIWVEDRDYNIVRFNGTYLPAPPLKNAPPELYFHFDSWRLNTHGAEWIPSQIYVEEAGAPGSSTPTSFKAQTRVWDYNRASTSKLDELTQILIESESGVRDQAAPRDVSPLESQRAWERQAEENVLARLEKAGLLAPPGPVDDVLNTVVNNLIVSANLNIDVRSRVLLTTPLETFSIGHTIVISRGLIDVLPDEPSLALVLADELSHIALGHPTPTQFAFHNQTMMSDAELFQNLHFERPSGELDEAGKKTIEVMRVSPYQKTGNAGLFLKALHSRGAALPRLLAANMGNQLANAPALARLADFTAAAPALEENKLEQIAALPLGSRVKLDPATGKITLTATKPLSLLSAREKMPFEVTPFAPYLVRAGE